MSKIESTKYPKAHALVSIIICSNIIIFVCQIEFPFHEWHKREKENILKARAL